MVADVILAPNNDILHAFRFIVNPIIQMWAFFFGVPVIANRCDVTSISELKSLKMPLELSPSTGFYDAYVKDGWFTEKETLWPGQRMSIEIEEILEIGKSKFQDILVFKSKTYGTVLVLDGVIQVTERDEFSYQEMITHLPMFAHPNPKKVLIVGGGDGGVLREVAKHSGVETIHMCEIDVAVCEAGKKYFPTTLSTAFNDPRLTLMIEGKYSKTKPSALLCYAVCSNFPVFRMPIFSMLVDYTYLPSSSSHYNYEILSFQMHVLM